MKRRWTGVLVLALSLPVSARAAQVTYRGFVHTSQGAATLTLVGDSLRIANIGSTGQDGVSIALPTPGGFHIDLGLAHLPATGHQAFGAIAGPDTISFGRVSRLSPANDSMQLQMAFADAPGITHYRVQAFLGGVLQRTRDVALSALPVTEISTIPESDICIRCFFRRVADWVGDHMSVTHGSIKVILPDLSIVTVQTVGVDYNFAVAHGHIGDDPVPVNFDNLVIYPVGATASAPSRDRVFITGADQTFTLAGEAIVPDLPVGGRWTWWLAGALVLGMGVVVLRARQAVRASEA